jgi:asparagine synthetase B (glutamine-hydrolysing)
MAVQQRVAEYRRRMRARGYRPIQIWVPDVRSAAFAAEAARESSRLAAADHAGDDQDFVDAISIGLDTEE